MGNLCTHYEEYEGRCMETCELCINPFEDRLFCGYSPTENKDFSKKEISTVFEHFGIKTGDVICTKYIFDSDLKRMKIPCLHIMYTMKEIASEMEEKGIKVLAKDIHVVRNVRLMTRNWKPLYGTMLIAFSRGKNTDHNEEEPMGV